MKIWEILKRENIGREYEVKIYGLSEIVKVDYDVDPCGWLTVKGVGDAGLEYPLKQLHLREIVKLDFEEVK